MIPSLTKLFPFLEENNNKIIYTVQVSLLLGLVALLLFVSLFFQKTFIAKIPMDTNEYLLLIVPLISTITIFLLKINQYGLSKFVLIFGSLFIFAYSRLFIGQFSRETLILNPIIIITISAFTQFIFNYKKEKIFHLITTVSLFLLLVFFNEILSFFQPDLTLVGIVGNDLFVIRLAYTVIFISINFIIYFSVKFNEKIQSELDDKNNELEQSQTNLLNQNIQLKEFKHEIVEQNKKLKKSTQALELKNKVVVSKNNGMLLNQVYTNAIKDLLKNDTNELYQIFNDYFIYDKPKKEEFVTSNLFWSKKINNKLYFVLADTHQESSSNNAILSVLIIKILNSILDPNKELSVLLNEVFMKIDSVRNHNSELNIDKLEDFLELSLCSIDISTNKLNVVTHNQQLWFNDGGVLKTIKSNVTNLQDKYNSTSLNLKAGDVLYLYTNSFKSIRGVNNEMLTSDRFNKVVEGIMNFPMNIQEEKLSNFINDWIGNANSREDLKFIAIKIN